MFSTESGMMVPINDRFLYNNFHKQDVATVIKPIAITVITTKSNHVDKTVMSRKKDHEQKGIYELLALTKYGVKKLLSIE